LSQEGLDQNPAFQAKSREHAHTHRARLSVILMFMSALHTPSPAIEIKGLNRSFGAFQAVTDLSLSIPRGTFFGFLGPNGAGKSTTIKMLTGLLRPDSGQVQILGYDLWRQPEQVKRLIGVVPENMNLFERLTAPEYLEFAGGMYGLSPREARARSEELLELMQLTSQRETLISHFSHGMKKKTALAAALIHGPQILFLDEPFEGIDPVAARTLRDLLLGMTQRNMTIFLTSHILEIVEKLCDHLGVIDQGRLLICGPVQDMLARMGENTLEQAFIRLIGQDSSPVTALSWLA
jgi:ABC-2 type transport system ATP-binding protein